VIKSSRIFFVVGAFLLLLLTIPLTKTILIKTSTYSFLGKPLGFSRNAAQIVIDAFNFRQNAEKLRLLKAQEVDRKVDDFEVRETTLENERLTQLLDIRKILPSDTGRVTFARVIVRAPSTWNRIFLIDKGTRHGIRVNQPVLSEQSLIGKIIEAGPAISKVLLISDPNSKIGVLIQRTRQQGVLYGTFSGECRVKYLSVDTAVTSGDVVESAGYGGLFPKGILVGTVERAWKEPGQIYQVAQIKPMTDLSRIEEVACIDFQ
jgi:rod shape-determining protein MreC